MNYNKVASLVEVPDGSDTVVKQYQSTKDIIKDLIYCFKEYNYQAAPVKGLFASGNTNQDGRNIYNFIKDNIEYEAEPEKDQTTRSFSRIIYDKWGDCKHNALLAASIAWNMGYNVIFKFVSYVPGETYGHVYTIIENPKTRERIVIDPLQDFNYEKYYNKGVNYTAINKKTDLMLSRLTGVEENSLSGIGDTYMVEGIGGVRLISDNDIEGVGKSKARAKVKAAKKASRVQARSNKIPNRSQARTNRTAKKVMRKAKLKDRGGIVKTVSLAPIRAAGSLLILANFRGFATRFTKLPIADQQAFAKKFGYKYETFKSQAQKGSTKKPVFGSKANGIAGMDDVMIIEGIGAVSLAAAAITAAPMILALTKIFSDKGLFEDGDNSASKQAGEDIANSDEEPKTKAGKLLKKVTDRLEDLNESSEAIVKTNNELALKREDEKSSGFFAAISDSIKEKPVLWLSGAAITILAGGVVYKKFF